MTYTETRDGRVFTVTVLPAASLPAKRGFRLPRGSARNRAHTASDSKTGYNPH